MSMKDALAFIDQISQDESLYDEYMLAHCHSEDQIVNLAAQRGFEFNVPEFRQSSKLYLDQYRHLNQCQH